MAAFDDDRPFGEKPKPPLAHEIGQNLDDLSAPELAERIGLLHTEIERLEKAIAARQATRAAADLGIQDLMNWARPGSAQDRHCLPRSSRRLPTTKEAASGLR